MGAEYLTQQAQQQAQPGSSPISRNTNTTELASLDSQQIVVGGAYHHHHHHHHHQLLVLSETPLLEREANWKVFPSHGFQEEMVITHVYVCVYVCMYVSYLFWYQYTSLIGHYDGH